MRKPLKITRIDLLSRALSACWKRSPSLPVLLMEMAQGPLEAIAGFSRGSGRS
ncbi:MULTISPECIES: hypothetical protein [Pseudomonas]|uniref:hypothetical protein n=1 Tax=Pseudomonas TaxID=286 RepID=UPI0017861404|nr:MULTISPECIES: hypothetical protein [Pseudomonas]